MRRRYKQWRARNKNALLESRWALHAHGYHLGLSLRATKGSEAISTVFEVASALRASQ
jgi:hypothetical protein